MLADYGESSS